MVPTNERKKTNWPSKIAEVIEFHPPCARVESRGSMQAFKASGRLYKGRRYTVYTGQLNTYQEFLYYRALYGLDVYTPGEIRVMKQEKRRKIKKLQKKTRSVIDLWKQDIVNTITNTLFTKFFPNSKITKGLIQMSSSVDGNFECNLSLCTIGVRDIDLVDLLITNKILPKNFYELKPKDDGDQ